MKRLLVILILKAAFASAQLNANPLPDGTNYLGVFFDGPEPGGGISLYVSPDGLNFTPLSGTDTTFYYQTPDGNLRDPSIMRYHGQYWVCSTTGQPNSYTFAGGNGYFDVASSSDLVHWTHVASPVTAVSGTFANRTYAPEWFLDPNSGLPHVYVAIDTATTPGQAGFSIYEMHPTSGDFTQWSSPSLVPVSGASAPGPSQGNTDPFMVWDDVSKMYYLFQDSGNNPWVSFSPTLTGTFTASTYGAFAPYLNFGGVTENAYGESTAGEGYCVFRLPNGNWRLFLDHIGPSTDPVFGQYYADSPDLVSWPAPPAPVPSLSASNGASYLPKHGTVISVDAEQGALAVTLSPGAQNTAVGGAVVFSGTLTNTSATDQVFLNGITPVASGSGAGVLTFGTNTFFANVPGILLPGETYTGPIFQVTLSGTAAAGDYSGCVTIVGGTDIFASDCLGSAGFTVSSPVVSIAATVPSASEFGPVSGMFSITRTGTNVTELTVQYAVLGTATNGVTYQPIGSSVLIAAGSNSANVAITPIPDDIVEGDRTVVLALETSGSYNLGASGSDTVIIHDKPIDQWKQAYFGAAANSAAAGDSAAWSGDGVPNIVKYALGLNPLVSQAANLPVPVISGSYLTLSYAPSAAVTDVMIKAEGSTDLINWETGNVVNVPLDDPTPPNLVTVRYLNPISGTQSAFLRLQVFRTGEGD